MALGPGSIAFVGFNADGTDNLAFVVLEEIALGTVITFTDKEWDGTAFNTGETTFTWTATSTIAAGTIVFLDQVGGGNGVTTSNLGTVVFSDFGNLGIGNGDETIYAFVGSIASPTFLTAVANGGYSAANGVLTDTGLTVGVNAINLAALDDDLDIAAFMGARGDQATFADYLPIINNSSNWNFQDGSGDQNADGTAPDVPFSSTAFTVPAAENQSVEFTAGSLTVSQSEGHSGTTDFVFTVSRAGGTTGDVDFSGTFTAPATDNADYTGGEPVSFSGTILDGQASATVTIQVAGDVLLESDENFTLTLDTVSNSDVGVAASLGTNVAATGTILDDDTGLGVDLSLYVRVGRFDLPEPTRTTPPDGTSLLAQEASGVTYNWDTDTLFITSDGGTSIVQVSKTGELINSMTLAPGGSPQGTEFYDPEGITYIGNGQFVMTEERDRQVVQFTYEAGTTLERNETQTVALGTFVGNEGFEGLSYDPATGGFIIVKETNPESIFQTTVDFVNGTASNGSPTATGSTNLFNPALAGLADFADVFALSNLTSLDGNPNSGHILILSQESAKIVEVDRDGNIYSTLTLVSDPGNPLSIVNQQHEGLTMDNDGFLYIVSENGGGDFDHPQLWVFARSSETNLAPTAVALNNPVTAIDENTPTTLRIKVADVLITDDGLGTNALSLSGADTAYFEVDSTGLYIKAGTVLDFETKSSYAVTVNVDDVSVGNTPDATVNYTLLVNDIVNENPGLPALYISEVAPWASGNSPVGADWFEITNSGSSAINIAGWKMDDNSGLFSASVALNGVTSIAPGESVIFFETSNLSATSTTFISTWFGGVAPAGMQFGNYTGGGVGLSTGGDAVNLYSGAGVLQASVNFGASPSGPYATFNNAAGINNGTISQLSAVLQNGGFSVAPALPTPHTEIGSPGSVGRLFVSEVAPWASGSSPGAADWFELTNSTTQTIDITGWKIDDNSGSAAAAVALNGITSIAPGESVIFIETSNLTAARASFLNTWFGGNAPAGLQIGSYTGSGVGLSTTADAVNIYNGSNVLQASLAFGASPSSALFATFDNARALNGVTISQLSANGVNAAFVAVNDANEVGSPGEITPVNDAPTAVDDSLTSVAEDSGARTISFASLIANDLTGPANESGQTLTITNVTNAVGGSVSIVGTDVIFTPTANYFGPASFEYTVGDNGTSYGNNDFKSDVGSVSFTITPVNDGVTINGTSQADLIDATNAPAGQPLPTSEDDIISGKGKSDSIHALGGNDLIDGGAGQDAMYGDAGDDTYVVDNGGDTVTENAGEGSDTVQSSVNFTLGPDIENLTLTGSGNIKGTGNALANVIIGNSGNNVLVGDDGADALDGGAGDDTASYATSGEAVDVSLTTGTGTGGAAQGDTLTGIEKLIGSSLSDTLEGDAGDNGLKAGGGIDTVTYAHASAGVTVSLALTSAQNTIGAGTDELSQLENLTGSTLNDILTGSNTANVLNGLDGDDELAGGNGADTMIGGVGEDTLIGGAGHDTLTGGADADIFVFGPATGSSSDMIADFVHGLDLIQITGADYGLAPGALDPGNFIVGSKAIDGHAEFVYNAATNTLKWDADGVGGAAAITVATFTTNVGLTASDFVVV